MLPRVYGNARRSVVNVIVKDDRDAYCSGCVLVKNKYVTGSTTKTTLVIASLEFVKGRSSQLEVVFFDRVQLKPKVFDVRGNFCVLETAFHKDCEAIRLLEDDIPLTPSTTFMFTPTSHTTNRLMSTYTTIESLKAYRVANHEVLAANSTTYFMVACAYFQKTSTGINGLTAAPVFTVLGKTKGIVQQDCRHKLDDAGAEMKVALTAAQLHEVILSLDLPPPPRRSGNKRKRSGH